MRNIVKASIAKLGQEIDKFEIGCRTADYNPQFYEKLYVQGKAKITFDYYIEDLEEMLDRPSFALSKALWKTITSPDNEKCNVAGYKIEWQYSLYRVCDSTVIYMLKHAKWVPDRNMVMFRPADISVENIHPDFKYDSSNAMLRALEIGKNLNRTQTVADGFEVNDEKEALLKYYDGKCQMCGKEIVTREGDKFFLVERLFEDRILPDDMKESSADAWNGLCLCPNCAAQFRYCHSDLSDMVKYLVNDKEIDQNARFVDFDIALNGRMHKLRYSKEHFEALSEKIKSVFS